MPLTPFHLGPGLALKAVAGRRFSLSAFGLAQVLIDLEPLYYLARQDPPLHRFFHTGLGASLVLAATLLLGKPVCEYALRLWNRHASPPLRHSAPAEMSWAAAASGAALGVYSHVLLDSLMHYDVRPYAPLTQANPLYGVVGVEPVYLGCAAAGAFGIIALLATRLADKRPESLR
jgi:hypothetical protein